MLTYADHADERRPKFGDANVVSCASGATLQFLDHLPAGCSSTSLMGLPKVDASCAGCQKVKVPYLFGALQSPSRFKPHSEPFSAVQAD